jgi:hypothetical protein
VIPDGAFFTLSDGRGLVRFEFDVVTAGDSQVGVSPGSVAIQVAPNATAATVARAVRNAINSTASRSVIDVTANNSGDVFGVTNPTFANARSALVYLNGEIAANFAGSVDSASFSAGGVPILATFFGAETVFGEDLGDGNSARDQGQFVIQTSVIRDSSGFGLNLDAAPQAQPAFKPTVSRQK